MADGKRFVIKCRLVYLSSYHGSLTIPCTKCLENVGSGCGYVQIISYNTLETKILVAENYFTEINFTENFSQKGTILQFKAKILVGENFSQQAIP